MQKDEINKPAPELRVKMERLFAILRNFTIPPEIFNSKPSEDSPEDYLTVSEYAPSSPGSASTSDDHFSKSLTKARSQNNDRSSRHPAMQGLPNSSSRQSTSQARPPPNRLKKKPRIVYEMTDSDASSRDDDKKRDPNSSESIPQHLVFPRASNQSVDLHPPRVGDRQPSKLTLEFVDQKGRIHKACYKDDIIWTSERDIQNLGRWRRLRFRRYLRDQGDQTYPTAKAHRNWMLTYYISNGKKRKVVQVSPSPAAEKKTKLAKPSDGNIRRDTTIVDLSEDLDEVYSTREGLDHPGHKQGNEIKKDTPKEVIDLTEE